MDLSNLTNEMARKLIDALNKNTEAINNSNSSGRNVSIECHASNGSSGGGHCK